MSGGWYGWYGWSTLFLDAIVGWERHFLVPPTKATEKYIEKSWPLNDKLADIT